MKRNMDLIRAILLTIESHEHGFAPDEWSIDGYSEEEIGYHAYLLIDSGLASGIDQATDGDQSPDYYIRNLTWAGHEFLDAAREPGRWKQAKELIGALGGASFTVWTAVLTEIVKRNLGLSDA